MLKLLGIRTRLYNEPGPLDVYITPNGANSELFASRPALVEKLLPLLSAGADVIPSRVE